MPSRFALDEINFHCPIISLNGAAVFNQEGSLVDSNPMKQESLVETVKLLEEMDLYFEMYTNRGTFSKNPEKAIDSLVDIFLSANPDQEEDKVREFIEEQVKDFCECRVDARGNLICFKKGKKTAGRSGNDCFKKSSAVVEIF